MNPFTIFRALGLAGKLTVALVALLIVLAGVWWATGGIRRDAKQAKVDAAMAVAHGKSAADAAQISDAAHAAQSASETLSRENEDAIRNAPGAAQALDPGLNDVARRRLCLRASLRNTPECVQLLGPAKPSR